MYFTIFIIFAYFLIFWFKTRYFMYFALSLFPDILIEDKGFYLFMLPFQIGDAAKLKPMEVELRRLEDLSGSIVKDFIYMQQREEQMRNTNG